MTIPSQSIGPINSLRNYSTEGLILNVDFNNDYGFAGNTAEDLANNVVYSTPGGFVSVASGSTQMPGSIDLDGTTDYLIAGTTTSDFFNLQSFTVDAWVYLDTLTVNSTIVSNGNGTLGSANRGFTAIIPSASSLVRMAFNLGTVLPVMDLTGVTIGTGQWSNIFWRIEASTTGLTFTGKIFKPNGLSASNYTGIGNTLAHLGITSNNFMNIGGRPNVSINRWDGKISSVRIYNRVLSTDEIEFNYARNKTRYGHT